MSGRAPGRRVDRLALGAVLAFACLAGLLFLDKAFHIDEPLYLPAAWHILSDPLHPFAFELNYYGTSLPYARINNTPPLLMYLLAAGLKLTSGREWALRLLFLPFDLAAAAGLFLLASRFLSRPLLPVLAVLASPIWWINVGHLMPEKLALAFGLWALYGCTLWAPGPGRERGKAGGPPAWFWASAVLMALAVLSKYNAGVLLLAGAAYAALAGGGLGRAAAWAALGLSGGASFLAVDALTGAAAPGAAWEVTRRAMDLPTSAWSHTLRSLLAFLGGGSVVLAAWPFLALRPGPRAALALAFAAAALFCPFLDIGPVRLVDRLTGVAFSAGALWLLAAAWSAWSQAWGRRGSCVDAGPAGWLLWGPWLAIALAGAALYWSVMARTVLLAVPPAVLGLAALAEKRLPEALWRRACAASLAACLVLGLALSWVDCAYAGAQRRVAREAAARIAQGRRVWCAGHWGLQYYLERAGAGMLDESRGGWDEARPGDAVIVPAVNTNILRPRRRVLADVSREETTSSVPLRLICSVSCEGGFYSNVMGFLPFSLSLEPLDAHETVVVR